MWLADGVRRGNRQAARFRARAASAVVVLVATLSGCGSATSSKAHERSEAGVLATIRAAEAEFRAGDYEAFCQNYLTSRLRSVIETVARGKSCAQLLHEQAARANEANLIGVLKPGSHVAVSGDSATVYAPHERTLFVYDKDQWRADWSEEVK